MLKAENINAPVVVIDTREKKPLEFPHLQAVSDTMQTGDYGLQGLPDFCVERKSIADMVNSLTGERERFWRELERLRAMQSRGFARLLIIGTARELAALLATRNVKISQVMGSLAAIDARFVPVVWASTPERAAAMVEGWAWYYWTGAAMPFLGSVKVPEFARGYMQNVMSQ